MTLDEVCDEISWEGLAPWQKQANREWLEKVWASLKMGGVWYYPHDHSMWIKTEEGFDKAPDFNITRMAPEI